MSVAYDLYSSSADFVDDLTEELAEELAARPEVAPRHLRLAPVGVVGAAGPAARTAGVLAPTGLLRVPAPERLAPVAVLRAPSTPAASLHLTRRGVLVLSLLVAALGAALVWVAALSAPSAQASSPATTPDATAAAVTVHSGDTLWAIASRVAPGADPRAEVAHLRSLNHLDDPALTPGQVLRVR